jgi:hypothetical protein
MSPQPIAAPGICPVVPFYGRHKERLQMFLPSPVYTASNCRDRSIDAWAGIKAQWEHVETTGYDCHTVPYVRQLGYLA